MNKNPILKSVLVLTAICLLISAALALVNSVTAPIIDDARILRETASRQALLSSAVEFIPVDETVDAVTGAYKGIAADGSLAGYVFTAEGKGFDGTIVVMCAIDPDGSIVRVATMDVTSETKTLGGLTAETSYTDQYIGKTQMLDDINAISGATITSDAYKNCIRECFSAFDQIRGDSE